MTVKEVLEGIEDEQYIDICRKENFKTFYYGPKRECYAHLDWFEDKKILKIWDSEANVEGTYFDDTTKRDVTMIIL